MSDTLLSELLKRVESGVIVGCPHGDLTIFNYSNQCVYDRAWDEYTLAARGLVLDKTGRIVARPWPKFFNLNERPETMLDALPRETPELSHKYDGSLVIVFHDGERWRAITRGCWDNPQTRYAEHWLSTRTSMMPKHLTYLFELVAPWNRIVIPYANEDMILIGLVTTETGIDANYSQVQSHAEWLGFRSVEFESKPLDTIALDDPMVRDREGFVARFPNGLRVKLKYKQYMILHKILTGLSVKGIWELLSGGTEPTFDGVPDEFMDWYAKQRDGLKAAFANIEARAKGIFAATPRYETRKEYALEFTKQRDVASVLFAMLDGKAYAPIIWKALRPEGKTMTFQVDHE